MKTQKHTPGPWIYNEETAEVLSSDGKRIAEALLPRSVSAKESYKSESLKRTRDANGKLIAMAPELLAAVEALKTRPLSECYELILTVLNKLS